MYYILLFLSMKITIHVLIEKWPKTSTSRLKRIADLFQLIGRSDAIKTRLYAASTYFLSYFYDIMARMSNAIPVFCGM